MGSVGGAMDGLGFGVSTKLGIRISLGNKSKSTFQPTSMDGECLFAFSSITKSTRHSPSIYIRNNLAATFTRCFLDTDG